LLLWDIVITSSWEFLDRVLTAPCFSLTEYAPSFRQTGSRSVLTSLSQRKTQIFTLRKGTTQNFLQAIEDVRSGKCSFLAAGKKYGVSHMTLYRYYLSMGYPVSSRPSQYVDTFHRYKTYQYQWTLLLSTIECFHAEGFSAVKSDCLLCI
jgi:hypothetical protein